MRLLAGLRVHEVGEPDAACVRSLVILLHGYGAPGTDLVPLADEIATPRGTRLLFPEAPINLAPEAEIGVDVQSRAWWPIDLIQLQVALASGKFDGLGVHWSQGLAQAAEQTAALVTEATEAFQVPLHRVILGGFSQGAIVALAATLAQRWKLGGMLLFSGTLLDGLDLSKRAKEVAPMPCVISHGQFDPILPFELADSLQGQLRDAGWRVRWVPFLGGHGIPPNATSEASELIAHELT